MRDEQDERTASTVQLAITTFLNGCHFTPVKSSRTSRLEWTEPHAAHGLKESQTCRGEPADFEVESRKQGGRSALSFCRHLELLEDGEEIRERLGKKHNHQGNHHPVVFAREATSTVKIEKNLCRTFGFLRRARKVRKSNNRGKVRWLADTDFFFFFFFFLKNPSSSNEMLFRILLGRRMLCGLKLGGNWPKTAKNVLFV